MATSQNVDLLFVDGDPDGAVRAELVTGMAIVYRITSPVTDTVKNDPVLEQPGLYLLINTNKRTAYVGKADKKVKGKGVLKRMMEKHNEEVDAWDIAYAFIHSKPTFFQPTQTAYLERAFYDAAVNVTEYKMLNGNTPSGATPGKGVVQACEMFKDECLFLLSYCLRCDVFIAKEGTAVVDPPSTFVGMNVYLESPKRQAKARAVLGLDGKQTLVKKGSVISIANHLPSQKGQESAAKLRDKLTTDGTIVNRVFTRDHLFTATTAAASVICGSSVAGSEQWKDKNGNILKALGYGK